MYVYLIGAIPLCFIIIVLLHFRLRHNNIVSIEYISILTILLCCRRKYNTTLIDVRLHEYHISPIRLFYIDTNGTLVSTKIHRPEIFLVHSCQQKSIGLKCSKSQTGSDVRYSCHHNSSRFTFPIFAHSCRFSVLHSLQSITPLIN